MIRRKCDSTFTKRHLSSLDKRVCPRATGAFSKAASYGRFSYHPLCCSFCLTPASDNRLLLFLFLPIEKNNASESFGMALHVISLPLFRSFRCCDKQAVLSGLCSRGRCISYHTALPAPPSACCEAICRWFLRYTDSLELHIVLQNMLRLLLYCGKMKSKF